MSLYILADMEGACGIYKQEQFTPGAPEWKRWGRTCLSEDIRSAIDGASRAGLRKATVRDYHGFGANVARDMLPRSVEVIGGVRFRPLPAIGKKAKYSMAFLIAHHASVDSPGAFYPHILHHHVKSISVNGRIVSEAEIMAAVIGEGLETPVGLVSGDPVLLESIAGTLPWAELVPCSKRLGDFETVAKRDETIMRERKDLFEKSRKAVERASGMKRFQFQVPVRVEIELHFPESPIARNTWGLTRISAARFALERPDFLGAFRALFNFLFIPRGLYPLVVVLGPLLSLPAGSRLLRMVYRK
ncbi:MAG: M55 family metallopeptidase [Nitrospinae bacterium]|nr:M55 family metallopeptidase [Nitrospinota bacterium]